MPKGKGVAIETLDKQLLTQQMKIILARGNFQWKNIRAGFLDAFPNAGRVLLRKALTHCAAARRGKAGKKTSSLINYDECKLVQLHLEQQLKENALLKDIIAKQDLDIRSLNFEVQQLQNHINFRLVQQQQDLDSYEFPYYMKPEDMFEL